ncbi:type III-B CRISPR-associated protein Cas10/Cmr2 [Myxococcota bacterium]|nr:type III-B CRISPR-associated protein Cas10/Cmr2 [Myxococcota bacterium]
MTTVLVIHVGPVQPFIASARRLSDLLAGSRILSDLAGAAARGAQEAGATLIFPADVDDEGSPNKVLAYCPGGPEQARAAVLAARKALGDRWSDHVQEVIGEFRNCLDLPVFQDQARLEDWCQFYAAWATRETYAEARDAAERLLDGRKRTRDFLARDGRPGSPDGRPKSWLDAGREDVLDRSASASLVRLRRRLLLKGEERLDALGAVKRLDRYRERFASINDITIRAGRRVWPKERFDALREFEEAACRLFGVSRIDAAWYFPDRLEIEAKDAGLGEQEIRELRALLKGSGFRSTPYYALVLADGDGIGAAISGRNDPEAHRALSRSLQSFAVTARGRIRDDAAGHLGEPIYCGGDDVLAAFPLATAVHAATDLSELFAQQVPGCSLSAGIAVAHMLTPFDRVREWAATAEREAKKWRRTRSESLARRGALALRIRKRSGDFLTVCGPAAPDPAATGNLAWALGEAAGLYDAGQLAEKAAYDLRVGLNGVPAEARWDVARRILARKRGDDGQAEARLESLISWVQQVHGDADGIEALIGLLLAGRFLHQHRPRPPAGG